MRRRTKIKKQMKQNKIAKRRRTKLKHELIEIEMTLQSDYCSQRKKQEEQAVSAIKTNSKHFFSYAKKFSTTRQGIGPLTGPNSEPVSCPQKMAEMLSNQYASVWTTPSDTLTNNINNNPQTPTLADIDFTPENLEAAIDELTNNASPGPDKYPAILLKRCKNCLS